MEPFRAVGRFVKGTGERILVLVGALMLGFGVPVFWLWVASRLYAKTGAVTGPVAAFIFVAILLTYSFALLAASWIRARMGHGIVQAMETKRAVWNRSVRDEVHVPGDHKADFVEKLFVATTIVVGLGFLIWFFVFAGAPFAT